MPQGLKHYENVLQDIEGKARLCAVTKKHSIEEIMPFYEAGQRMFGENHAQELAGKAPYMPKDIQWSFIGHLQHNKVKQIVPYASLIQSVDSIALAEVIDRECAKINKVMPCLAEFHLALEDENKSGMRKEEAVPFFDACEKLQHIDLQGIMVMGPHTADTERIREVFTEAHELYLMLQKRYEGIHILSMGMSADYKIALECGSNMVRVGTYLFTGE